MNRKEDLSNQETEKIFRVYCGVSEASFNTCMTIVDGSYVFDKSKFPQHEFETTFYMEGKIGTMQFAMVYARKYGGQPLVISGQLDAQKYSSQGELPKGEWLIIDRIVIFKDDVDWRSINEFDFDQMRESIIEIDVEEFMKTRESSIF